MFVVVKFTETGIYEISPEFESRDQADVWLGENPQDAECEVMECE